MTRSRLAGVVLAVLLAVAGWFGYRAWRDAGTAPPQARSVARTALDDELAPSDVMTVDLPGALDAAQGATPMAQRVAVLGLLNKRNGATRDVTLHPGQAVRIGEVVMRLRACEQTAPWEQQHYTGAFVQLDVEQLDRSWRRVFSGWLYKERPGLNVVEHPIYDVWTKSCAMTFPLGGVNSVAAGGSDEAGAAPAPRSSAKKSPAPPAGTPRPPAPAPTTPAIADDNSPT